MNRKQMTDHYLLAIRKDRGSDFPQFLTSLRRAYGLKRKEVAEVLDIPYLRLFMLENGYFARELKTCETHKLAQYYDIELEIFNEKMMSYLASGEGVRRRRDYESRHPCKANKKNKRKKK